MDDLTQRQALVGRVVRDGIMSSGQTYAQASRDWNVSLPTLHRLLNSGNVGLRFYRRAETQLGLPRDLLSTIVDGDVRAIADMPNLDPELRVYILRELGATASSSAPKRRRRA